VAAVSLAAMQVDVTNHLGAVGPATSTGLPGLDQLLGGGLRSGMLLALSGRAVVGEPPSDFHSPTSRRALARGS